MKKLVYLLSVIVVASSCLKVDHDGPKNINLSEKAALIIEADNQFGIELFQEIDENAEEGKNLMISPTSVSLALAMAYNGALGDTKQQMEEVLHKEELNSEEINQSYLAMVEAFESIDAKVELSVSNAIFYRDGFSVNPDFLNTNQSYYDAEVSALNFLNEPATLQTVNGWVDEKTHGKISEIIGGVSSDDMMYLINAIYFNAEWTIRFDEDNTANRPFYLEDGNSIEVPTMYVKDEFNCFANESFKMLEMSYGAGKFSMFVLLPEEGKTVAEVISLLHPDILDSWIDASHITERQVFLPKFEFRFDDMLRSKLQTLGMIDTFDPVSADFTAINEQVPLCITEVIHKTYIKVDEKGTEAAAATAVIIGATSAGLDNRFIADHPFVFFIREKETNAILFVGKVMNPLMN